MHFPTDITVNPCEAGLHLPQFYDYTGKQMKMYIKNILSLIIVLSLCIMHCVDLKKKMPGSVDI